MFIDFEYADKRLSDYDYILCRVGDNTGVSEVKIGCDIKFNTIKNNHSSIHHKTSTSYDEVYTNSFEIMKKPCGKNQNELYITDEEVSFFMKWLNRHEYRKFKPIATDGSMNVHYYGSFNVSKKTINDRTVALILAFTGNAPYGFGENIKLAYDITSVNELFYIHGVGDEIGILYPNIRITCKQNGDLIITNNTSKTSLVIKNCLQGETIYLNGEHKIIKSDNVEHDAKIGNDFNYEYFDIQISDDDYSVNEYNVSIPCLINVDYSPIRKVGVC